MSIAAFQLSSGITVLANVEHEGDEDFLVKDPVQLNIKPTTEDHVGFYLVRYMPFNDEKMVLLKKSSIQSLSTTSDLVKKMYKAFLSKEMNLEEVQETSWPKVKILESNTMH